MTGQRPDRTTLKRWLKWIAATAIVAFLLAWAIGEIIYPRTNPPERYTGEILSPASDTILRTACFNCHSNETHHPWYRHLPLGALFIGLDIREGRDEVNFSHWGQLSHSQRVRTLRRVLREVREGDMPPLQYRLVHSDARLTSAQIAQLAADARARYGVGAGSVPGDERVGK